MTVSVFSAATLECHATRHRGQDGLFLSMCASHAVGLGNEPPLGHTNDRHVNGTNSMPAWHTGIRVGVWQCSLTVGKAG